LNDDVVSFVPWDKHQQPQRLSTSLNIVEQTESSIKSKRFLEWPPAVAPTLFSHIWRACLPCEA
jgi:hypothetical protein